MYMHKIKTYLIIFCVSIGFLRLLIGVITPIDLISNATYDDALFIRLAEQIARGNWLGEFGSLTLAKGSGYPIYLSFASISGLPLTIFNSLIHVSSFVAVSYLVWYLTKNYTICAIVFISLSLFPLGVSPILQRVVRDQIYWAQILIFLSAFSILIFNKTNKSKKYNFYSFAVGLFFGWLWITREEGMAIAPSLSLIVICVFINKKTYQIKTAFIRLAYVSVGFLVVNFSIMTLNYNYYGSFIGVDFKEQNFERAVRAIQGANHDYTYKMVPSTVASREKLSKVSPLFSKIAQHLKPGDDVYNRWITAGCEQGFEACSEIYGGWFVWAVRDAALKEGFYSSPSMASERYKAVADEILSNCGDAKITCASSILGLMPPVGSGFLLDFIPSAISMSLNLSSPNSKKLGFPSKPTDEENFFSDQKIRSSTYFYRYWDFLNYPAVKFLKDEGYSADGWFLDHESHEWPRFEVVDSNGKIYNINISRIDSKDLIFAFNDSKANLNRFSFSSNCFNQCILTAQESNGLIVQIPLEIERNGAHSGPADIYIDNSSSGKFSHSKNRLNISTTKLLLHYLMQIYRFLIPVVIFLGILSFVYSMISLNKIAFIRNELFCYITSLWVVGICRVILLTLIDVTSFSTNNFLYGAPVTYSWFLAGILSIYMFYETRIKKSKEFQFTEQAF